MSLRCQLGLDFTMCLTSSYPPAPHHLSQTNFTSLSPPSTSSLPISSEMERKSIRRECLATIINILVTSSAQEVEDNLTKIKTEMEMEMDNSKDFVMKKLSGMKRALDKEIKELSSQPSAKVRRVKVAVEKLSSVHMYQLHSLEEANRALEEWKGAKDERKDKVQRGRRVTWWDGCTS